MKCIGALAQEYRRRMYALLALYARPFKVREPVVCIDEKSLQLVRHSHPPMPMSSGQPANGDFEYVRNTTTNLFVAVEPKGGQGLVSVTERRTKPDFVEFVTDLLKHVHRSPKRVH